MGRTTKITEEQLHKQICEYMRVAYPKEIFNTDASGLFLTIGVAVKLQKLRSGRGIPDIVLYYAKNGFQSLFMEIKKESPYIVRGARKGELKKFSKTISINGIKTKVDHHQEQAEMMQNLTDKGFCCSFVWSFDQAKTLIDDYIKGKEVERFIWNDSKLA